MLNRLQGDDRYFALFDLCFVLFLASMAAEHSALNEWARFRGEGA